MFQQINDTSAVLKIWAYRSHSSNFLVLLPHKCNSHSLSKSCASWLHIHFILFSQIHILINTQHPPFHYSWPSVTSDASLCLTSLPSARCRGGSLASHSRWQESDRPGVRGITAAGQQEVRQQGSVTVALVKVDWRRKTLRSLSSDGRTMVLSGSSPRQGQVQGGPTDFCDNPLQEPTLRFYYVVP